MNKLQIDLNKIYPGTDLAQLFEIMTAVQDDLLQYDGETHVSEIVDHVEANTDSYLRLWGSSWDNPEATVGYRLGNVECDLDSLDDDYQSQLIESAEAGQKATGKLKTFSKFVAEVSVKFTAGVILGRLAGLVERFGPITTGELQARYWQLFEPVGQTIAERHYGYQRSQRSQAKKSRFRSI